MIQTRDERNKRNKKTRYFFPQYGRSVEAFSQEEAERIISNKQ
jgi:hypothetical protein